jgi:hypothetical protein
MLNIPDLLASLQSRATQRLPFTAEGVFVEYISADPQDLALVKSLRDVKTSVCGKRIEQKTLSFQCFECAPDPHHMFCVTCFVKEKHKSV